VRAVAELCRAAVRADDLRDPPPAVALIARRQLAWVDDLQRSAGCIEAQAVASLQAGKSVTIPALPSGYEEKARAAGCNDYETKPVDLPRLLAKIEALLNRKNAS
jgi:CheY-like chemotaxis protein